MDSNVKILLRTLSTLLVLDYFLSSLPILSFQSVGYSPETPTGTFLPFHLCLCWIVPCLPSCQTSDLSLVYSIAETLYTGCCCCCCTCIAPFFTCNISHCFSSVLYLFCIVCCLPLSIQLLEHT